jgi:hypothetical protein
VHVWSTEVLSAGGDDGIEIDFGMVVFDKATGQRLIQPTYAKPQSVGSGDVLTNLFGANDGFVRVPNPTATIVPFIRAVSQDPLVYWAMPDTLPAAPASGSDDGGAWAGTFGSFSPPTTVGDVTSNTMVLSTGLSLLSYLVKLTFETIVTDPNGALEMIYVDP